MSNPQGQYREITFEAVAFGILQGVVMTSAFVYAGLKLGLGPSGSTISAIMGYVLLKVILGKGTIVENNINQAVASSINTTGAGIIFTLPVLYLMGYLGNDFSSDIRALVLITIAATAGSLVGTAIIIPLRKQMIDFERLRFPSGTAVAVLMKAPGAGVHKATLVLVGSLLSGLLAWFVTVEGKIPESLDIGKWLGMPAYYQTAIYISLMNLGAGLLAGRGGLSFAVGGVLAYWVLAPLSIALGWVPTGPDTSSITAIEAYQTDFTYKNLLRPLGIGFLIGGSVAGAILAMPILKSVLKGLKQAAAINKQSNGPQNDEMPFKQILITVVACVIFLFGTCVLIEPDLGVGRSLIIALTGMVWILLAGMIVSQCAGNTDTSPISGLSLIGVTLILFLSGGKVMVTVLIGVTVCVAISQCSDMMSDLKTGFLIGGIPVKIQVAQLAVAWIGPVIAVATVALLWKYGAPQHGFGPDTQLTAPQATTMKTLINGVINGNAPIEKYLTGGLLGAALTLLPVGGLGVLVGLALYLPFSITLAFGIGALISTELSRIYGAEWVEDNVTPLASGFIVGEALIGLGYALYEVYKAGGGMA